MDKKSFRSALSRFASGVTVITTQTADGTDHGMTASAFTSVSLDPPLVLVCVGKTAFAHDHIAEAGTFAVNILGADQVGLSDRFAHRIKTADGYEPWPDDRDKFSDLEPARSAHGNAVFSDVLGHLDCTVHEALDGGDHTIFLGQVEALAVSKHAAEPLLFFAGQYRELG